MTSQNTTNTKSTTQSLARHRPRWATAIHDLGDDLCWALQAWTKLPRPSRTIRVGIGTAVGWLAGADTAVLELISAVRGN